MRPELETYHLIDRYLSGELKGDELASFEIKMQVEADFAQEIELQKLTNTVVASAAYDKLREQMKADIRALDAKKAASKSIWKRVIAGSSLAICAGFGYYFYASSENVLEKVQTIDNQGGKSIEQPSEVTPKMIVPDSKTKKSAEPSRNVTSARKVRAQEEIAKPIDLPKITEEPVKTVEVPVSSVPNKQTVLQHENLSATHKPLQSQNHSTTTKVENATSQVQKEIEEEAPVKESARQHAYTIHASSGETWKIPAEGSYDYKLHIYNSAGVEVFKHNSINSHLLEWDGSASNGALLESGIYVFIIEYINGTKETGQITLVK